MSYEIRGSYYVTSKKDLSSIQEGIDTVIAQLNGKYAMQACGDGLYFWLNDEDLQRDTCADHAVAVVCKTEDRD